MDQRIHKYMEDTLTSSERLELLREIEMDESLKKEFIELQNIKALLNISPETENREEAGKAYIKFTKRVKQKTIFKLIRSSFKYVAAIAVIIFSTYWITNHFLINSPVLVADNNTLFVPAGQRAQITLQDGTIVWLNAKSTLIYPSHFFGDERTVSISGEAYFEVAKDDNKPFIVDAQDSKIKVRGTHFNVYCYPDAEIVQTSLLEGAIDVFLLNSTQKVSLKPNEQITITGGKATVGPISNFESFLWKDGIYSFVNERLEDIVKKFELYYDIKIIIEKSSLKDIRYTCKFRQREGIKEILDLIHRIHSFKISEDKEANTITLS